MIPKFLLKYIHTKAAHMNNCQHKHTYAHALSLISHAHLPKQTHHHNVMHYFCLSLTHTQHVIQNTLPASTNLTKVVNKKS